MSETNPFVGTAPPPNAGGGTIPPAGNNAGICVAVIDLGTHDPGSFQGEKRDPVRQVVIVWELPGATIAGTKNTRHHIAERYTLSFHEKAKLRKTLESWRGAKYGAGQQIDLQKLLGRPCLLNIMHQPSGERVYAKLKDVTSLPQGMQVAPPSHTPFAWYIGGGQPLPEADWLPWVYGSKVADLIASSPEWQALAGRQSPSPEAPPVEAPADDYSPDGLPVGAGASRESDIPW